MNVVPEHFRSATPISDDELERYMTRRERKQLKKKTAGKQNQAHGAVGYKPLTARTEHQQHLIDALNESTQVFAIGPAGTGKTYVPSRLAAQQLKAGKITKIYIARPTVAPKRHAQGFLPGKLEQKLAPWLVPIMDALKDEVSANVLKTWLDDKKVEFLSFEHMRGRTLSDCWVILDEAQNCTLSDLKLFLTRKGQDSVYVVAGDIEQVDGEAIPDSGLEPVIEMIDRYDLSPEIVEFDEDDVVRSADAKEWVQAFSRMSH